MEGLTKLAKLDFLLRYPNCLERALAASLRLPSEAKVHEFERTTIESKMVRFRYGPWDDRYRRWVSLMAARNLVKVGVVGKTVQIWLTPLGHDTAALLSNDPPLEAIAERASAVAKQFGNKSGSGLMNFVYDTFPELTGTKWAKKSRYEYHARKSASHVSQVCRGVGFPPFKLLLRPKRFGKIKHSYPR